MLHTSPPTLETVNARVPHSWDFDINYNDTGIASGVYKYTVEASALRPVFLRTWAEVITDFNAGSGNIVTLGTTSTATELLGSSDITEGTPGLYPSGRWTGALRIVADTEIWAKYAGGAGIAQVETAVVAENTPGTLTAGNATLTVTTAIAGFVGSPLDIVVALATNDTEAQVATKFRAGLAANAQVAAHFTVSGATTAVILTAIVPAANDGTLNIAYADTTSAGLVDDSSSNNTTAGVAPATTGKAKFYIETTPLF